MTTATARREAARGNGVASAGQFGLQTHSAPGMFLPVDRVKQMDEQIAAYTKARDDLISTGQVYAGKQLLALFPTAVRADVTFADRIGRYDEPVGDPDVVRVQDFAIFDKEHVDLVEKLDDDIEQIKDTAAGKHRKLTKVEQNKLTTLETDRDRLREHAAIALSAMEYQAMSADFDREYQLSISKVELSVDEAKDLHFEAMDRARAEAHATIDLYRQDLAAYAEDYRLDQVGHVEVHTPDTDAFEEEQGNITVNRVFDRDGEVIYDYATGGDSEVVDELVEFAERGLYDLNAKTDDANLRQMSKLARDAATFGIDPQHTSKGLPASNGTFGKMPLWDPSSDPTSVPLFDA
ncbi:hypothetical protein [Pseudoclavibacter sp. VKM Ac-2867]|uniref:hypothetical protein n=1 Tax=Pseudoclavibacter sp. VKM Ac-2867 TaxID=2783829 RepID=UPI00188DBE02|nr:hypothetical protein [Pseudoclavibacter sp. VKM Ac-2867]MBF4459381.1 hypothetical protein [Pseudoclavibacter sp. VKM Ac-2867]